MANHLTPEIGEGKKFKWITNNLSMIAYSRIKELLNREES